MFNAEWLNQNALRAYPFREDSSRKDTTGTVVIPDSVIVDLCIVVPADFDMEFYLSRLVYMGSSLVVVFSDADGVECAATYVDLATHTTNKGYTVTGMNSLSDLAGRIVFGDLSSLNTLMPQGSFSFDKTATPLEIRAVRPDLRRVRALRIVKADGTVEEDLTGAVRLVEGINIKLSYQAPALPGDPHTIRIDSRATDLEEECACDTAVKRPECIRSINGVPGDVNGNIQLTSGNACVTISGGTSEVRINDVCCTPCPDCPPATNCTDDVQELMSELLRLESVVSRLDNAATDFRSKVLSSL